MDIYDERDTLIAKYYELSVKTKTPLTESEVLKHGYELEKLIDRLSEIEMAINRIEEENAKKYPDHNATIARAATVCKEVLQNY